MASGYDWSGGHSTARSAWIEAEGRHRRVVNAEKLETIYVTYKRPGVWGVVGTIGNSDILIHEYPSEKAASDAVDALLRALL